jgi:hypothetical protein
MDIDGTGGPRGMVLLNYQEIKKGRIELRLGRNQLDISYPPAASGSQMLALHMVDKDGTEERLYILKANKQNPNYVFFSGLQGYGRGVDNGKQFVELYPEVEKLFRERVKTRFTFKFAAPMPTIEMDGKWYRRGVDLDSLGQKEKTALANLAKTPLLPPVNAPGAKGGVVKFKLQRKPIMKTHIFTKPVGAEKLIIVQGERIFNSTNYKVDNEEKRQLSSANGEDNVLVVETGNLEKGVKKISVGIQELGNKETQFEFYWKFNAAKEREKAEERARAQNKANAKRKTDEEEIRETYKNLGTKARGDFKTQKNFCLWMTPPNSIPFPIVKFSPPK